MLKRTLFIDGRGLVRYNKYNGRFQNSRPLTKAAEPSGADGGQGGVDERIMVKRLKEKLMEALRAVLPMIGLVLLLCFTIAPISPSILLCFLLGGVLLVVGEMFFTLGAEMSMSPMGERVGACMVRSRKLWPRDSLDS